ncbi:cytochrome P450 [Penicillium atrosanguineum]|uniref:Cytochrome P450 n=1 Tax=Penicillium atrosanguineum TaxID=1132637 RepID=A0A9W9Q0H3_9EURO|nr:cytochrome P450 [Penicillium atrosanguineum]
MGTGFILEAGLVVTLGYLVSWCIYCRAFHPLSKVPGPFWSSFTRLWLTHAVSRGDLDVVQRELHRRYGPLVRIAPDEVACADPDAIRKIYRTTSPLNKSDFYHLWDVGAFSKYPNAFAIVPEKLHFERRRIVSSVYILTTAAASSPLIRRLIMGLFTLSSTARKGLKGMNHIIETARKSVDNRASAVGAAGKQERKDILHNLLAIVYSKGDRLDFSIEDVKNEAFAALTAGADATMIELQAVFYYLAKDRCAYEDVRKEVDQAVESGKLSDFPSYSEAVQLPLLTATIKEALRMHPAVGMTMPRIVDEAGIELSGIFIPPGWKVGMNAAVVGRDKGVYGPDVNTFRPKRWIERTDLIMERCNSLVFGAGTRTCIGKQIALMDPSKSWSTHDYFFNKQSGLQVKVRARGL